MTSTIYKRHHSIETTEQDYARQFGSLAAAKQQCFNIGAGVWQHESWTNIDLPPQSEAFAKIQAPCIYHDLVASAELPIVAGSAALIYTSHVIEHLPDTHANKLFASVHRSLGDGGLFRVTTGPDADTDLAALLRNDDKWWYFYDDADHSDAVRKYGPLSPVERWLLHVASPRSRYCATPCARKYSGAEVEELLDLHRLEPARARDLLTQGLEFDIRYPGDHLSWWNAEKLVAQLRRAGFATVAKCAYGQSRSYLMRDLRWFDTTYPQISLYVEARK